MSSPISNWQNVLKIHKPDLTAMIYEILLEISEGYCHTSVLTKFAWTKL